MGLFGKSREEKQAEYKERNKHALAVISDIETITQGEVTVSTPEERELDKIEGVIDVTDQVDLKRCPELAGPLILLIAQIKGILAIPQDILPKGHTIDNVTGLPKFEAWRLDEEKKNKEAFHLVYEFKKSTVVPLQKRWQKDLRMFTIEAYAQWLDELKKALLGWND